MRSEGDGERQADRLKGSKWRGEQAGERREKKGRETG